MRGCVALARGPLVYCVEQADHPDDVAVEDLRLDPASPPAPSGPEPALGVPVTLAGAATVRPSAGEALYTTDPSPAPATPATLTAIPYFRWANRELGPMRVWIPAD